MKYYNFSKEEIADCADDIKYHNLLSLCVVSIVNAVLILLLSFYPKYHEAGRVFHYLMSGAELALFFISFAAYKKKNIHGPFFKFIFFALFWTLVFFCLFVYKAGRSPFSIRFLLVFLSFQIVFVTEIITSVAMNVGVIVLFFITNKYFPNTAENNIFASSIFDIFNIALAAVVYMILNLYTAHVIIKGIITSNSLERERNRFLDESIHDQLTGLNNRRSFEQSVDFYTSVCRHVHQTVCVVMMDVDFFKNYNDFYGHTKGDIVLQAIGTALKELAEEDSVYVARVGGEEFLVLWTENRVIEAERIVLKLRQKIIGLNIPHEKSSVAPYVTASFGMYFMRGGSMDTREELYNNADIALYKAKAAGRNCVILLDSADKSYRHVELRPPENLVRH
ncbi:MAG: GGDEF domain-containing protein [Spirochaetaceae bacterium]|nr:GGDEF domain-containing protein [Spirochaetaceae bacterium]